MKHLHLILLIGCVCAISRLMAQNDKFLPTESYELINPDKPPSFPGGEKEMFQFIYSRFRLHPLQKDVPLAGTKIVLSFSVDTLGNLGDFQILKDMGAGLGDALVQTMQSMPCWIPGEINGKKAKTRMTLPLQIHLD